MEVIESCTEPLCNRQVLDLLRNYKSKKQTNLATILYETTSYLESSPAATSSLKNIAAFLDILNEKKYPLTKMEKIQLVNMKPQNETELHLMIDNIEEKLTEEQRNELLGLIKMNLDQPSTEVDCDPEFKRMKC